MRSLESQGHEAVGIDAATGGDITDEAGFRDALARCQPDAVVHVAALLTPASADDPVLAARVNCVGSAVVMHCSLSAGVSTVLFASSVAAIAPRSVYGATKAFGEHLATALHYAHPDSRLIGLRFGWIYGEGRARGWNEVMKVVSGFALERDEVRYPEFDHALDWTHIDDAAAAVVACLERAPRGVNLYDVVGDRRRVSEAVDHLRRRFPETRAISYAAVTPPTEWSALDPRPLADDICFRCSISMEEGLDRTVDAIRRAAGLAPRHKGGCVND
jgi:UDP-glucose 4-epimerase